MNPTEVKDSNRFLGLTCNAFITISNKSTFLRIHNSYIETEKVGELCGGVSFRRPSLEDRSDNLHHFCSLVACCVTLQQVLCFIVFEVKMSCSCFPKAKTIQSCVRKQSNCLSFGNKSKSSRIPTQQASFVAGTLCIAFLSLPRKSACSAG